VIVGDHERFPKMPAPDPFLAWARVLCGEVEGFQQAMWESLRMSGRRHALDVAHDQLVRTVRLALGDRALPCNCTLGPDHHALYCVTLGHVRTVEQSERWKAKVDAELAELRALGGSA
jgi:hypothetical protein